MPGTVMINPLEAFNIPLKSVAFNPGFELLIFATNWGYTGTWEEFCARIKNDGYDGAEVWYPENETSRKEFLAAVQKHDLKFAFCFGGSDRDFQKHVQQFTSTMEAAAALNPVYLNSHSGRDYFSFEQNKAFIDFTAELNAKTKVPVYHETHRGRILYAAPVSRRYMEENTSLRLTLDISHWCNVHESLLDDQYETVKLALERTDHIHARIGHAEGPQVNDPRAPEWTDAVNAHFTWWDTVAERKSREGKRLTMLTEFGPVDYLPALPYTRQPVANQWEINKYMLGVLKKRYSSRE